MSSLPIDDIRPSSDAWWKPQVGDVVAGEIVYVGVQIQDDFDKKGGKELSMRIDLRQDNGEPMTVYATKHSAVNPTTGEPLADSYTKRDAAAIADAVRRAGRTSIDVGGRLAIQRLADVPSNRGGLPAKDFYAEYAPPKPNGASVNVGPAPAQVVPNLSAQLQPQAQPAQALTPATANAGGLLAQQSREAPGPFDSPVDLNQLAVATGIPVSTLGLLPTEQIASLAAQFMAAQPAPAPAQPTATPGGLLGGLLAPRP